MKNADQYFNNCRMIAERYPEFNGRKVRYKVFSRKNGLVIGSNKAVNFIKENSYGAIRILGLKDGDRFSSGEQVLIIEGNFNELVNLETTYLGFLSYSGSATAMKEIVDAAKGVPIIDMSARHFPWQIIEEVALAAYIGGAAGTSTQAGYDYVQKWYNSGDKFKLYASLPHAMAAVAAEMAEKEGLFPSVMAAKLFNETFPDKPITVLADYEGLELAVAKQAYEIFGKKLFAVRIDTHGGRNMQGTTFAAASGIAVDYLGGRTGRDIGKFVRNFARANGLLACDVRKYLVGNGVTAESAFAMRDWLDFLGARNVKIVVSSGFDKMKVRAFQSINAPMDFIGTGSYVKFTMFTSDISDVWENGEWKSRVKVGRKHGDGNNSKVLFERK